MCEATPTLRDLEGSSCGPLVGARHVGLEQRWPARAATVLFTSSLKSSLTSSTHRATHAAVLLLFFSDEFGTRRVFAQDAESYGVAQRVDRRDAVLPL
jgi:hypothetical protein